MGDTARCHQPRTCLPRARDRIPSSMSATLRGFGGISNTASWMSRDEYFDTRRTNTSPPLSYHSIFDPGVNPKRRRIRAGTDTCPRAVIFDSNRSIFLVPEVNPFRLDRLIVLSPGWVKQTVKWPSGSHG